VYSGNKCMLPESHRCEKLCTHALRIHDSCTTHTRLMHACTICSCITHTLKHSCATHAPRMRHSHTATHTLPLTHCHSHTATHTLRPLRYTHTLRPLRYTHTLQPLRYTHAPYSCAILMRYAHALYSCSIGSVNGCDCPGDGKPGSPDASHCGVELSNNEYYGFRANISISCGGDQPTSFTDWQVSRHPSPTGR
jgi:hypothetical protein